MEQELYLLLIHSIVDFYVLPMKATGSLLAARLTLQYPIISKQLLIRLIAVQGVASLLTGGYWLRDVAETGPDAPPIDIFYR